MLPYSNLMLQSDCRSPRSIRSPPQGIVVPTESVLTSPKCTAVSFRTPRTSRTSHNVTKTGSFARVLINKDTAEKIQPIKNEDSSLNLYTYTDAIISSFVSGLSTETNGLPYVTNIQLTNTDLRIRMPYYGITLDEWCRVTSYTERLACLQVLLIQLCNACSSLLSAGIQHTDIKPSNIIIDKKNLILKLIDYNIYTIKTVNGWTPSVGTWCYVAPEILYKSTPSNTSMIWSIGMIMAEICGGNYVLGPINTFMKKSKMGMRKEWKSVFTSLQQRNSTSLSISHEHEEAMRNTRWMKLFQVCTRWNPCSRISLDTLTTLLTPIDPRMYLYKPNSIDSREVHFKKSPERDEAINQIQQFCETDINTYGEIIYRSIFIYDILKGKTHPAICICVANIMMGFCIEDAIIDSFTKVFNYTSSKKQIEEDIMSVFAEHNKWDLYWIGADVVAISSGISKRNCLMFMAQVMKTVESPYTCSVVVEALFNCCARTCTCALTKN